jgi:MarR family transcriptional regulator, organic hydroperoxide resistance regulator
MMDETILKKILLLMLERDALVNKIFTQDFLKKIIDTFSNLSKSQLLVIKIIGVEGEVMPSTIGSYTGTDKSTITRMIDDLENKGMVIRKNDPGDRRRVLVSLTDKGIECCNYFDEIFEETLGLIDENDLEEYLRSIEITVTILKKIVDRRT